MTARIRPDTVFTALGPVEVVYVAEILSDAGEPITDALGHVSFMRRRIQILDGLHPDAEAHALRHEWVHLVLFDSGADNFLTERRTELLCDTFATALLRSPPP